MTTAFERATVPRAFPILALSFLLAGPAAACRRETLAAPLRVAAAADLQGVLPELARAFEAASPGSPVEATYGSSGNFLSQIESGAPFDLFLSADLAYPKQLAETGRADSTTLFRYAVGRIVLWVRADSPLDPATQGLAALRDPAVRKVAIANPRHAPYGRAAEAALRHAGLLPEIAEKLVLGENVAQAAQFVQSGAADAGIVALSLARAEPLASQGKFGVIPADAHPVLEQGGVVLSDAKDPARAQAFRDFCLSADGRAIFRRFGFALPGE